MDWEDCDSLLDEWRYCLYLPGICMHVRPVTLLPEETRDDCSEQDETIHEKGKGELQLPLHLDIKPFLPERPSLSTSSDHRLYISTLFLNPLLLQKLLFCLTWLHFRPSPPATPGLEHPDCHQLAVLICADKAFENTSPLSPRAKCEMPSTTLPILSQIQRRRRLFCPLSSQILG